MAELLNVYLIGVPTWHIGIASGLSLSSDLSEIARTQSESVFEAARKVARRHDVKTPRLNPVTDMRSVFSTTSKTYHCLRGSNTVKSSYSPNPTDSLNERIASSQNIICRLSHPERF